MWYRDHAALSLIARRYLPWLAGLNLAWELAQLPLYTIWREANAGYIAFAVAHCTVGDILIGAAALALALIATRAGPLARWRWLAPGRARRHCGRCRLHAGERVDEHFAATGLAILRTDADA
ncbi:MAG TPA: hypothetical protein VKC57_02915 [Ktedonobacterales bacterium]|nr:hypothetical protein [Ktedonobacterales bacterium]